MRAPEVDFTGFRGETARLLLRPYHADDLKEFVDLHGRDDVARYLPWPTRDEAASRAALGRHEAMSLDADDDGITLAAVDDETGRLVGEFVLILRSVEHRRGELGYVVHPDFQGRGLAVEGSRHVLQVAFEQMKLHRMIAHIDARNRASASVLTKLGFRHEAHLVQNELFKGEWSDEDDFAMLRSEWQLNGGAPPPSP